MKMFTAILGTALVMLVAVAAMDTAPWAQAAAAAATRHVDHAADKACCNKPDGMCARTGKDAGTCCEKDNCCKDGKCQGENCTCECCKTGGCCKSTDGDATTTKDGCCKRAPRSQKPILMSSH